MTSDPFTRRNVYGEWSRDLFADAAIVQGPARTVYVAGMASEDPSDGHIHFPGDCAAQTRMSYDKIKAILAAQGTYAASPDSSVVAPFQPQPHLTRSPTTSSRISVLGVASLAWPGMVVEVEVTAVVP